MITSVNILFFLSALLCGLLAGLFYGYDCSVIRGLGGLTDREYLLAFQSISKAILNPYFFISFMGCLLILPVTTLASYNQTNTTCFILMLSATLVYTIGAFGVTVAGNVPLNEKLAGVNLNTMADVDIAKLRLQFEETWNYYHRIRTVASIACFGLILLSLFRK